MVLIWFNAASTTAMASCAFASLDRLADAIEEKVLEALLNTSALCPASVIAPLLLATETEPVLIEESVLASVSVTAEKVAVWLPAVELA